MEKSGDFWGYWYKCFPNVSPSFEMVKHGRKKYIGSALKHK